MSTSNQATFNKLEEFGIRITNAPKNFSTISLNNLRKLLEASDIVLSQQELYEAIKEKCPEDCLFTVHPTPHKAVVCTNVLVESPKETIMYNGYLGIELPQEPQDPKDDLLKIIDGLKVFFESM